MLKQPCQFYQSTRTCRFGEKCRFSHDVNSDEPAAVSGPKDENVPTRVLPIEEKLSDSDKCRTVDEAQESGSKRREEKICEFYANHRFCKFGNRCKFKHVQNGSVSVTRMKSNQNQRQNSGNVETKMKPEEQSNEKDAKETIPNKPNRQASKQMCHFYRQGYCRFGSRCHYSHSNTPKHKSETSNSNNEAETKSREVQQEAEKLETERNEQPVNLNMTEGVSRQSVDRKVSQNNNVRFQRPPVQPARVIHVYKRSDVTSEKLLDLRKTEITLLKRRFPSDKLRVLEESDALAKFVFSFQPTDPDWPYDVRIFEIQVVFPEQYPLKGFTVSLPCDQDLPETVRRYIEVTLQDWLREKDAEREAKDCIELGFRLFLRWLDRSMEDIVTEALKQLRRELTAQAAGLQFIPAAELQSEQKSKTSSDSEQQTLSDPDQEQASSDNDQKSTNVKEEPSLIVYKKAEHEEEEVYIGPSKSSHHDSADDSSGNSSSSEEEDDEVCDSHKDNSATGAATGHQRPKIPLDTPRQGTEMSFRNLQLWNIATILVERLRLTVQCERCKHFTDFNTPPNRVNSVACAKCHAAQLVVFRPVLAHAYASTFGYLDLDGCLAHDVILQSCHMSVGCSNCSQDLLVKAFSPGHVMELWCRGCHNKIKFAAESVKLTKLAVSGTQIVSGKVYEVKINSLRRVQKDPAIQEGKPLPDNGSCKHYKKSYRWLRFPCCGKTYPCDVCHDSKEDHEMKFANRMICGFCCREQPYANEKPCLGCSNALTKVRSSHWEGGKGCRDKVSMSRNDNKKYVNQNKTTSTKAKLLQEKQKGKKNTKLRHA